MSPATQRGYMAPATAALLDLRDAGAARKLSLDAHRRTRKQLRERIEDCLAHGYTVTECHRAAGISRRMVYVLLADEGLA